MSQYPGGQQPPPNDPYYGQQGSDPYAQPQPPGQEPYYGAPPPADPYAPPPDPYYGAPPPDAGPPPGQYQQPGWGPPPPPPERQSRGGSGAAIFGIILVIVGVWVLFGDQLDMDLDWSEIWPIGAVIIGAVMVLASLVPGRRERDG
jgi:hypothetical protein